MLLRGLRVKTVTSENAVFLPYTELLVLRGVCIPFLLVLRNRWYTCGTRPTKNLSFF
jgi:hypothetical protein